MNFSVVWLHTRSFDMGHMAPSTSGFRVEAA